MHYKCYMQWPLLQSMFATTEWMNVLEKNKSLEIVDLNNMCAVFFFFFNVYIYMYINRSTDGWQIKIKKHDYMSGEI